MKKVQRYMSLIVHKTQKKKNTVVKEILEPGPYSLSFPQQTQ